MILTKIFNKPVDRPIEGVIKADDEASLRVEIEEYVLTNEVGKRLESFLAAYNNYENANGVWVSGFFGSGKSHLLKMLALLLENRKIDDVSVLDLFLPKCGDHQILRADLKRAVAIPSKSILFNIDQKTDVISKKETDALLGVFVKVFNEMCGYYGKQGYIAEFERDIDSRGLYEQFKTTYQSIAGKTWQKGREQALLEVKNIATAYAQVAEADEATSMGILEKYRTQYRVSIEDFAEKVNAYIEKQAPNFRLNFFVDEVGQYIADNIKLMTNLQTIAESLATKCRGRAWVIVTAQEDMELVVGEMGKQQGNDFSKIQARFANRMQLTSADVAEVIQKRLLMKTEEGVELLSDIYHVQSNNFKTLFDFADSSAMYRNFQDRDHFIQCYPFIPYQFALFQSAIQNLSQHNAFEGKHSSVGERSMLGVFQQVVVQIRDHEIGELAAFDLMFEGIRTVLKSQMQRAIIQAENNLDNPFAIRLLKTLFLIKYVKEFKPTVRNLCVLLLNGFNQDIPALKKQIEEALSFLEQQTYVQRNGELYEYLTDEEKDVEQEIKNTDVEAADIAAELEKIIFEYVIKSRKIRLKDSEQDYSFSRKLDDRLYGREYELAIHVISPFHEHCENEQVIRNSSAYNADELIILMPADARLVQDILMYKRTDKYIRHSISTTQQEAVKRILNDKGFQNRERYAELQQRAQNLMGKAKVILAGADIEISSDDAQARVLKGFQELIARVYPSLRMLRGITYTEKDIASCLSTSQQGLTGNDAIPLAESEQELLAYIQSNERGGVRTTLKNLLEQFERKPYGWSFAAVLCTLAKLCARSKVQARVDGNLLDDAKLEQAIRNTHGHSNVVLEPLIEFKASDVRALKEFFEDFLDSPPLASEGKPLGKETGAAIQALINQLELLANQTSQYPFLSALVPVIDTLKELTNKPYTWYLTELIHQKDALINMKVDVIDPVRKFMSGPQKNIYDTAREFVQSQKPNFVYIESDEANQVMTSLNDPNCFKGNSMQQMKARVDALQKLIAAQIKAEIERACAAIDCFKSRLCNMPEFSKLNGEQQEQIIAPFNQFTVDIERQTLIAAIRDNVNRFQESVYSEQLSQMTAWAEQAAAPSSLNSTTAAQSESLTTTSTNSEQHIEYVSSSSVQALYDKAWLADIADVDCYLEFMRKGLIEEINKGKRIRI